ncbi:hypothetical protein OMW55_13820, partial [Sphingomonas sp. BN140010]
MTFNSSPSLGDHGVRLDGGSASLVSGEDSEDLVGVTPLDGGGYVVHWVTDADRDGDPDGLAVQRFAADGTKLGGVTVLQGISSDLLKGEFDDVSYDLRALDNGGYVLTYGLVPETEAWRHATVTASASGQTMSVPLVGSPSDFYIFSSLTSSGATFSLAGLDNNGQPTTVALTLVDGHIQITAATLDQFSNDTRLSLVVKGLSQGERIEVDIETHQEWRYDPSAALDNVATSYIVNTNGIGVIATGLGRPEAFHVDSASYANGTGPTSAQLQITTAEDSTWFDLTGVPGATRLPNGVILVPVTADANGIYHVPSAILAQLGESDAQTLLILGGLTTGSTVTGTVSTREGTPIPAGVFVQTFNANGMSLGDHGVRLDGGSASLVSGEDSEDLVGVTPLDGGGYVVHWVTDADRDGDPDGLAVQRFAADGTKLGGVTVLQGISSDLLKGEFDDVSYDLRALDNGGYVLTYGLVPETEAWRHATVTASASGQTMSVPLVGSPSDFYIFSSLTSSGATFSLAGLDNNGQPTTVALTLVDGHIQITAATLDQFSNDTRLSLVVKGLSQGERIEVDIETHQEWRYDPSAALDNVATSYIVNTNGIGVIATGLGRPEAFHVDSASYANGTGPTSAQLQITTAEDSTWFDLTGVPGATRLPNGVILVPVTADANGIYHVPSAILAQLGESDAQTLLILGGLTTGSTVTGTVSTREGTPIPAGVFVQTFNANGIASLHLTGTEKSDVLTGGLGDDSINGGAGIDTAVYSLTRAQASVVHNADGTLTISAGKEGIDRLFGVEQIRFSDGLYSFQFDKPGAVLVSNFAVGAGGWSSQDVYPRHVADMNGDGYGD